MPSALIGYTGFIGSNLAGQHKFDELYNSSNIDEIRWREFDLIACAGVPGTKWVANSNPEEDSRKISNLLSRLDFAKSDDFVLISTVDAKKDNMEPYGENRRYVERCIMSGRDRVYIIRLPALFGDGLKKNALFDLMKGNRLDKIAENATYQWYNVNHLWSDIEKILSGRPGITTLGSEPITMKEIRDRFFPGLKIASSSDEAPNYQGWATISKETILTEMGEFIRGLA